MRTSRDRVMVLIAGCTFYRLIRILTSTDLIMEFSRLGLQGSEAELCLGRKGRYRAGLSRAGEFGGLPGLVKLALGIGRVESPALAPALQSHSPTAATQAQPQPRRASPNPGTSPATPAPTLQNQPQPCRTSPSPAEPAPALQTQPCSPNLSPSPAAPAPKAQRPSAVSPAPTQALALQAQPRSPSPASPTSAPEAPVPAPPLQLQPCRHSPASPTSAPEAPVPAQPLQLQPCRHSPASPTSAQRQCCSPADESNPRSRSYLFGNRS